MQTPTIYSYIFFLPSPPLKRVVLSLQRNRPQTFGNCQYSTVLTYRIFQVVHPNTPNLLIVFVMEERMEEWRDLDWSLVSTLYSTILSKFLQPAYVSFKITIKKQIWPKSPSPLWRHIDSIALRHLFFELSPPASLSKDSKVPQWQNSANVLGETTVTFDIFSILYSPEYGPGFPGSPNLCSLHLSLLQLLDKCLLSITMCQALPRGQIQWTQHNFYLCPPLQMLVFSKVLSTSLILHLPEPSLYLCGFILFLDPNADDSQGPCFSPPYLFSWIFHRFPKFNTSWTKFSCHYQHSLCRSSPPYSSSHAF